MRTIRAIARRIRPAAPKIEYGRAELHLVAPEWLAPGDTLTVTIESVGHKRVRVSGLLVDAVEPGE